MRGYVLALGAIVLVSCATPRLIGEGTEERDSITTRVVERVVTVHDTVTIETPPIIQERETRDTVSVLANAVAKSVAQVSGGTLSHSLEVFRKAEKKPVRVDVPVRDSIRTEYRYKTIVQRVEVPRPLSWWQQTQIRACWLFLALLFLQNIKRIYRFFI